MAEIDPRKMALQIAGLRANEIHLPENERVFQDPYAEHIFPDEVRKLFQSSAQVKAELDKYERMMPGVNGAIVARIKFFDDKLTDLMAHGLKLLVIIGAGYDTKSYRIRCVEENLKVFEVDHPVTQAVKIEKVKEIFHALPAHVIYVPFVFGESSLAENHTEQGYNQKIKTLFIIEGLLMYIPPSAAKGLLSFTAEASGPEIAMVADYFDTTVVESSSPLTEAKVLRQFVESEGASLKFGIEPGKGEAFFKQFGFRQVHCAPAPAYKDRFFKNESSKRTVSPMFNFVFATK